jgi:RND family efflux transporter MFP subunit
MNSPEGGPPPRPGDRAPLSGGLRATAAIVVIAAIAAAAYLAWHRSRTSAEEATRRVDASATGPVVRAIAAVPSAPMRHLVLLAEARPFQSVTLYAKVSGYLKSISVDKGDHVKANQVVAVIESPETDAAWSAATADYNQKALTASRLKQLLDKKFASPEETDIASADEAVARERVTSLAEQREFEKLKVPFNGTVTVRFADPGALVQNAASAQTSALPVVTVEDSDTLRIYAYLDQSDAGSVRIGQRAVLTRDEQPGVTTPLTVARTSGDLDPKTRKMLVEFDLDNRSGRIVPGSFVHVELDVPAQVLPQIPAEALMVRQNRTLVAVLAPDSIVHFHDVSVASNDGKLVRILSGISDGDRVVLNAGDALADGARVRPAAEQAAPK